MADTEQISNNLLQHAFQMNASDVHFLPSTEGYQIHYRIAGMLATGSLLETDLGIRVISFLKYSAGMDIGERRKPQSKAMVYKWNDSFFTLRFSTLPAQPYESMAIRISPFIATRTLFSLSLFQTDKRKLAKLLTFQSGLMLFTGPTGSGKTTTIYAILEELMKVGGRVIVSIEDPVERSLEGVIQVETNERAGITFETALKAVLRHDPDVIVIGEIRDEKTAKLAFQAAITGHLVIASLHAENAFYTFQRLEELGINSGYDCIRAVVHQKLVKLKGKNERFSLYEWLLSKELKQASLGEKPNIHLTMRQSIKRAWSINAIDEEALNHLVGYIDT
ncbi:ATPase, T2SS/T4P/T4SS family [Shouchella patagoniensis]|uniref:ATPase, T2SS/T4P/T4SS family n=1 Tax=Shouchella patagoniensis TaxID=228576 RepID=UPI0009959328|nr:ATPase, T2SS/T4P/T4SS family [Shouchella patagoniensis]